MLWDICNRTPQVTSFSRVLLVDAAILKHFNMNVQWKFSFELESRRSKIHAMTSKRKINSCCTLTLSGSAVERTMKWYRLNSENVKMTIFSSG